MIIPSLLPTSTTD